MKPIAKFLVLLTAAALALLLGAALAWCAEPFDASGRFAALQEKFSQNRQAAALVEQAGAAMQREAEALQEILRRDAEAAKAKAAEKPQPAKEIVE